jgi:nucleotide-binding universal stress UspA family protein
MDLTIDHILVPVDFTEKNEEAIRVAQQVAKQNRSRITLLHVIESIDFPEDEEIAGFYSKLEDRAATEMDRLVDLFSEKELDVSVVTVVNNRCQGIVLYAVDNAVDLIVMNSHAIRDPRDRHGLATISYQVSVLCPCSVMLVKSSPTVNGPPLRESPKDA